MKKISFLLAIIFLLLSLSIWATETPEISINNFFVNNSETFFIQKNTVSNIPIIELIGTKVVNSQTNISNNTIDSKQQIVTSTPRQISNCNTDELERCLHLKSNAITTGLEHIFVADSKQREKLLISNQFYNIQENVFISKGTIFYVEGNQTFLHQKEFAQNHLSKNTRVETAFISRYEHINSPTITKTLPFSGNSFYKFCATKLATLPILKYENKKSNALKVIKHQKAFLDFDLYKKLIIAIANQCAVKSNFYKYTFSLPPPVKIAHL